MTTQTDYTKLLNLLEKAEKLTSEFRGGYSGRFLSAEEFHQALHASINQLKKGDKLQLPKLHVWFLPTSYWDDFSGEGWGKLSKSNQRTYINNDKAGMKLENNWQQKTLEILEKNYLGEPEYYNHLVRRCHELRKIPLDNFTIEI